MTRSRIAVVGSGHLGAIHARLLQANEQVDLIGIVDPLAETRERVAAECSTNAFEYHFDVIPEIDAAIIATPTAYHADVAYDLMSHGIHVLIEKPITSTVAEAEDLVRVAHENDIVLQVGHVEQFNPTWNAVRKELTSPRHFESHRCGKFSFRSMEISVVHDLMIHDIELVLSVVQSPAVEVNAFGHSAVTSSEDFVTAWIRFENGCTASMTASRMHMQAKREMLIVTLEGQYFLDFASQSAIRSKLHESVGQSNPQFDLLPTPKVQNIRDRVNSEILPAEPLQVVPNVNAIHEEHGDFLECIKTKQRPRVSGVEGRNALGLAEQVISQIRHKQQRHHLKAA